jgi:hypothetical protein
LASALYSLGFQEEAFRIEEYRITDLQGGAVDAFGKVTCFAKAMLPTWIITKCVKWPRTFNWKIDLDKRSLLLGVLNASDENCSHAVTLIVDLYTTRTNLLPFHFVRKHWIIAHQHKQRRVHLLISAELRFLLQRAEAGKG